MSFLEKLLGDPVRLKRLKRLSYVTLGVVAVAEVALPIVLGGGHPHFSFESWPAWGSMYGLLSCVAIIVISKLLGKVWLMRREDYYDS